MTYEKKQAFEADSEKIEALQQPGQFPELVATDESLVALYNEQLADGQSLTPLQAVDRAMDDETNWTTMRTFFRRAQRLVSERLTVIVSLISTVLTDVFGHLHERLDGNDEYGIPAIPFGSTASPAVSETLGTLPAAVRLLAARKITNGATDTAIPDGCSLARLLCDSSLAAEVTEIVDDNTGWTHSTRALFYAMTSRFSNLDKVVLGCTNITAQLTWSRSALTLPREIHLDKVVEATTCAIFGSGEGGMVNADILSMESLERVGGLFDDDGNGWWGKPCSFSTFYMPNLKEIVSGSNGRGAFISFGMSNMTELSLPALETLSRPLYGGVAFPVLQSLRMPSLKKMNSTLSSTTYPSTSGLPNLILLEVGEVETSMNLAYWSPTNVLSDETKLATFLTNFRDLIALRLTDNGAGKTLTLSQSVRDAIHSAEETYGIEDIIITQKGWAISPAPTV